MSYVRVVVQSAPLAVTSVATVTCVFMEEPGVTVREIVLTAAMKSQDATAVSIFLNTNTIIPLLLLESLL